MDSRLTLEAVEAMIAEQRRRAEQRQPAADRVQPARGRRFRRDNGRRARFVPKAAE